MLQAPTEGHGDAIVVPDILVENFEIRTGLLSLIQVNQFHGFESNNPHDHIRSFNRITSTLKFRNVSNDAIKLILFSYSLEGAAKFCSSSTDARIDKLTDTISNLVETFNKKMTTPAMVKAVEETCVICGGAHPYYDCIATDSNTLSACAATGTYNQGGPQNRASNQMGPPEFPPVQNNKQNRFNQNQGNNVNRGNNFQGNQVVFLMMDHLFLLLFSSLPKVVERVPEVTKDTVQPSTENIQPPVVQTQVSIDEPVVAHKPKPTIPYPSRTNKQKLREKDDILALNVIEIFRNLYFNLSFADALVHMPKFALLFKSLLNNKEKLFYLATTPVNENCSAVILKKLPEKLGDPDKFLIPCDFSELVECLALADLGASINLMPLSIWKKLSLPELTPTRMILELADRSTTRPAGIAEDVFVKVGKTGRALIDVYSKELTLRVDDEAITFIVGQTSKYSYNDAETGRALIDVYSKELTLRVDDEAITFKVGQTSKYSYNDAESINRIAVIDVACEEYVQKVLGFSEIPKSGNPSPTLEPIITSSSPSEEPCEDSSQSPSQIDHQCCYECGDPLDGVFQLAEYINISSWNCPAFSSHDDDDDENYIIPITPKEPDNSLSMGNEHLDTISTTKSDEVIKSSVEDLVPILSESEGIPDNTHDVPFRDNSSPLDVSEDQFEEFSDSNHDSTSIDDDYFSIDNINYVEASPLDSELVSLEEVKDDNIREKLLNINLLIAKIKSLNDNPSPDHVLKPLSPFPILVEDSNSFLEKSDTSLFYSDNSLLEFETFSNHTEEMNNDSTTTHTDYSLPKYDSFLFEIEPDRGELTSVVMKDNLAEPRVHVPNVLNTHPTLMLDSDFIPSDNSLSESKIFYFDIEEKNSGSTTIHDDISLSDLKCFNYKREPDPGELTSIVNSGIRQNILSTTNVILPPEEDHSPLFAYVVWIFLSFLTYPVVPPYLLSFGNEDTILTPTSPIIISLLYCRMYLIGVELS
nr:reverse transcriptase domain-containing protein [Tanacetum cinerariifolium]